jgi:hypothetical protein
MVSRVRLIRARMRLPDAVTLQHFEPSAWRIAQVIERSRGVELLQFAQRPILDVAGKLAARAARPNTRRILAPERPDHAPAGIG